MRIQAVCRHRYVSLLNNEEIITQEAIHLQEVNLRLNNGATLLHHKEVIHLLHQEEILRQTNTARRRIVTDEHLRETVVEATDGVVKPARVRTTIDTCKSLIQWPEFLQAIFILLGSGTTLSMVSVGGDTDRGKGIRFRLRSI